MRGGGGVEVDVWRFDGLRWVGMGRGSVGGGVRFEVGVRIRWWPGIAGGGFGGLVSGLSRETVLIRVDCLPS